jgi:hypothetical protein
MSPALCSASPFNRTNGGLRGAQECDTRFRLTVALMRAAFYLERISDSVAGNGKREQAIYSRARSVSARRPTIYLRSDSSPRGVMSARSQIRTLCAPTSANDREHAGNDSARLLANSNSRRVTQREPFRNTSSHILSLRHR